ncbi:MAG: putative metal-binding motif-containing protein [Deltaproteobacteria bacterium]|nr:putative metal-binding motif-containing protein [Deltaproteobacteria bacterium]
MRLAAAALVLAACGTEQGAYLVMDAPDGPATAKTYEIVLASPDEIPVIAPQRVTPTGTATETVTYYLQATEVSATGTLAGVNGYSILVEPTGGDGTYIPFILLRDGAGALVGMGTFRATDQGAPAPILVKKNEVDRYRLTVEPVAEVTDAMAVDVRQALTVSCQDPTPFTSGIVWRPRVGGELRVVLAEPGANGDATTRDLDLDCDGHAVAPNDAAADCDDTRARFHAGATEVCDMEDTNCDDIRAIAVPCQLPGGATCNMGMGVAVCDDTTGTISSTCSPDPTCACINGTGSGCRVCVLSHETNAPPPNETVPCQPGIGQIGISLYCSGGSPCTVQVLGTHGGWEAKVSANQATFGPVAMNVGSNVLLKVRRPEGQHVAIPGQPGHPVGAVDLDVIDAQGAHHYVGIELQMDAVDTVCPIASSYSMPCSG